MAGVSLFLLLSLPSSSSSGNCKSVTLRRGARSVAPSARLLPPIGRKNGICTDLHDSGRPVWRFYQRAGGLWHRSVRAWLVAAGVATTLGGGHRGGLFGAGQPAGSVEGSHAYQPCTAGAVSAASSGRHAAWHWIAAIAGCSPAVDDGCHPDARLWRLFQLAA